MENLDTSNWASKNLDVDHFRNGDKIPEAKTAEDWDEAEYYCKPAWCYYDNDPENGNKYGKLYNRHAVSDKRCLAPDGWHIPTDEEWTELENLLGEEAGKKLKSKNGWEDSGNGTDLIGFNALPGGCRITGYIFFQIGEYTGFWCTENGYGYLWCFFLYNNSGDLKRGSKVYNTEFKHGNYVRCVRDKD